MEMHSKLWQVQALRKFNSHDSMQLFYFKNYYVVWYDSTVLVDNYWCSGGNCSFPCHDPGLDYMA
jgi:hypothetical protein